MQRGLADSKLSLIYPFLALPIFHKEVSQVKLFGIEFSTIRQNSLKIIDSSISLTLMSENDIDYLYSLCKSTMEDYVIQVWGTWSEINVRRELERAIKSEEFSSINCGEQRIGAVSVLNLDTHYQLEQLYISRPHQNRGIGTKIIHALIVTASEERKPIRLRVLTSNPAKRLYDRLGFVVTKTEPERYFMEYGL